MRLTRLLAVAFIFIPFPLYALDLRLSLMPGADIYSDTAGWSAVGGIGLENPDGFPWSVGLWYGFDSVQSSGLLSRANRGGIYAGIPFRFKGLPVSVVPLVYGGINLESLQSGSTDSVSVPEAILEPGLEVRLLSFQPLEISLYTGFSMMYQQSLLFRNMKIGLSLAWVIPGIAVQPAEAASNRAGTEASVVITNRVEVTNSVSITNVTQTVRDSFAREIQEDLGGGSKSSNGPALDSSKQDLVIRFSEVLFPKNSTELEPRNIELLKLLSKTFIKYPNLIIVIEGFTDDVGDENYNQQLSEKRAKSVADVLYGMGISKRQAHYQGLGGLDPLVPNDSEENRSKNRRVEIRLYFVDSGKK